MAPPKTEGSERVVSLDRESLAVLKRWRVNQTAERRSSAGGWTNTGLVFTREDGGQLHPDVVTDAFARLSAAAGLPPIRLHDLRHTAASLALEAGVPLKVVSEQLGHSALAITADTYTSVLPGVAKAAAEAVAGIVPRTARAAGVNSPPAAAFPFRSHSRPKGARRDAEEASAEEKPQVKEGVAGAPSGTRTPNPLIKSQLLCQLS